MLRKFFERSQLSDNDQKKAQSTMETWQGWNGSFSSTRQPSAVESTTEAWPGWNESCSSTLQPSAVESTTEAWQGWNESCSSTLQPSAGVNRHHECAICREKFTSPRLLPCFHTFCLACLQQLVLNQKKATTFNCPICRMTTKIPAGGVERFQVNFYIEAEVEGHQALAAKKKCEICCKKFVKKKCRDCDQFMCNTCAKMHAAFASSKSHTVLNLEANSTEASEAAVVKERYCTTHKEEKLRFFCTKCNLVICRDCKMTSHEGHASVDLSEKSKAAKSLIQQVNEISLKMESNMKQAFQDCEHHTTLVHQQKDHMVYTLNLCAEELKKEIDDALQEVIVKLEGYTNDIAATSGRTAENMKYELACFSSQREYSESLLQKGSDADVLEMPSHFKEFFGNKQNLQDCKIRSFIDENWKVFVQHSVDQYKAEIKRCPNCGIHSVEGKRRCHGCGIHLSETSHKPRASVKSLASAYFGTLSTTQGRQSQITDQTCADIKRIKEISANWK